MKRLLTALLIAATLSGQACAVGIPPDAIGLYAFNENNGTNARDSGTNGIAGTLTNGATWSAPGQIGAACLSLDGTNDYVDLTNNAALNPAAMSFACWVKPANLTAGYVAIYSRNSGAVANQLFLKSNGKLAVYLNALSSVNYDGSGSHTLTAGTWCHVGFSYSSAAGLVGYVNGASDAAPAANGTLATVTAVSAIGNDTVNAGRFFPGLIDDVRFYNRVLTSGEFAALAAYTGPHAIPAFLQSSLKPCTRFFLPKPTALALIR